MTVSWLTLEQHAAGLLGPEEAAQVEAALAADAALADRFAALRADDRPLPPLPVPLPADSGLPLPARPRPARPWARVGAGLALAAAALLAVLPPVDPGPAPAVARYKGGTLALSVDRLRGEQATRGVARFADGDHLQLRLTCPPGDRTWAAVVFQGADRVALPAPGTVSCGNAVPLPGAFAVAGDALTVCVAVDGAHALDAPPVGAPAGVVCQALTPE